MNTRSNTKTPVTEARRGISRSSPLRVLVIGECGDGKSTLIDHLRDPDQSQECISGKNARGVTKKITEYKGKPVKGKEVVYLDTPGIGDSDVPMSKLFVMFEKELDGQEAKIDGVLVTTPVDCGRIKLGAQVVHFLVSKGFVGDKKWKNVVLVGTKNDKADDEDRQAWPQHVQALFDEADGKTGPNVLVDRMNYEALEEAIAALPVTPVTYLPLSEEDIRVGIGEKVVGVGANLDKFAEEMHKMRTEMREEMREKMREAKAEAAAAAAKAEQTALQVQADLQKRIFAAEDVVAQAAARQATASPPSRTRTPPPPRPSRRDGDSGSHSGSGSSGGQKFYKGGQFIPGGGRAPKGGTYA